jgi:proline dehydrogenase
MAGLLDRLVVRTLPLMPGFLMWPVAKRYIAGSKLADAIRTCRALNDLGATTTMDLLGEEIRELDEARDVARQYREALRALRDEGIDGNVSLKLSAFGIRVDEGVARELLEEVLTEARERGVFVRIDMEDATLTDVTLDLFRELRGDYPDLGVVLQACLKRTPADAEALATEGARVRLVKGIYQEPAEIALTDFQAIREAYVACLEILLRGSGHVAVATHDGWLIQQARRLLREIEPPRERFEFQMLLGVREKLRDALIGDGLDLRVYVPYGEQWRAYSVRRMKENPEIAGHVIRSLLPGGKK